MEGVVERNVNQGVVPGVPGATYFHVQDVPAVPVAEIQHVQGPDRPGAGVGVHQGMSPAGENVGHMLSAFVAGCVRRTNVNRIAPAWGQAIDAVVGTHVDQTPVIAPYLKGRFGNVGEKGRLSPRHLHTLGLAKAGKQQLPTIRGKEGVCSLSAGNGRAYDLVKATQAQATSCATTLDIRDGRPVTADRHQPVGIEPEEGCTYLEPSRHPRRRRGATPPSHHDTTHQHADCGEPGGKSPGRFAMAGKALCRSHDGRRLRTRECEGKVCRRGEPIGRQLLQGPQGHRADTGRHGLSQLGRRHRLGGHDLGHHRLRRRSGMGRLPGEHLVEHTPQRVNVASGRQFAVAHRLLGTHVVRRPQAHSRLGHPGATGLGGRQGDAEIRHQRLAIVQQDVFRLDVPMDDVVPVGVVERAGHF